MTAQDSYQRPVTQAPNNSWAVAALACAVIGLFAAPAEILAIIFGHIARGQIRRTGESGAGMALAALIIGYIVVILGILGIVFLLLPWTEAVQSGSPVSGIVVPGQ